MNSNKMFVAVIPVYNEQEFIEDNLLQHGKALDRIMVIDGCDVRNAKEYISKTGLSTDKTKEVVVKLMERNKKIEWYERPFASKEDKANFYITKIDNGAMFIRIDADEYYTFENLAYLRNLAYARPEIEGITYPIFNFWKRIDRVATGGLFDVRHGKCFRYHSGASFKIDHVRLCHADGRLYLSDPRTSFETRDVVCYHMGFTRKDIARYKANLSHYKERGEDKTRPHYMECREAFLTDKIPAGYVIKEYSGGYPEIFYSKYKKELFLNN